MKKTLVEMELSKFYSDGKDEFVVRPKGVEPKYDGDGDFKREVTKDYPRIKFTKELRDNKEAFDKALSGGKIVSETLTPTLFCLEFGLETLEHNNFAKMGIQMKQTVQRWFLNIWDIDEDNIIETYQNLEDALDALDSYIEEKGLLKVAMNDFIEKLTTEENLQFIEKATAQPKNKPKDAYTNGFKVLQSVENTENLRNTLIAWLGWGSDPINDGMWSDMLDGFYEDFDEAMNDDDFEATHKLVDKTFSPKCIEYFRELERMIEWYDSQYDPRCLTDNSIKVITEHQLDDLAKLATSDLKKSVGNDHIGGWYIKDKEENKNLFIANGIKLTKDEILFIEESGFEMFNQNFNSALQRLGYTIDTFVECYKGVKNLNELEYEMSLTYTLRQLNPQKEVK